MDDALNLELVVLLNDLICSLINEYHPRSFMKDKNLLKL